jgi:hypothetical protein
LPAVCEGEKDHSPETILAASQSLCEVSDKDVAPPKGDHSHLQSEGYIAETESRQIDGISKVSCSDFPAALQPADSNKPAESPNEHERVKETSSETGGGNQNLSQTGDDSHTVNLVGYSPSEGSDEDDSVQVAEAGDIMGDKETTLDAVPAIAGLSEPRDVSCPEPSGGIPRGAEPDPICEAVVHVQEGSTEVADPEDGSTVDQSSVQVSTTESEEKIGDDPPTRKENVESAAIKPETVEHAGIEADLSKEASQNEVANTPTQDESAIEPVTTVPQHVERASTEQPGEDLKVLNTQLALGGEDSKHGEAKTEQPSGRREADVAAGESSVVLGEEALNTEVAPDGKRC